MRGRVSIGVVAGFCISISGCTYDYTLKRAAQLSGQSFLTSYFTVSKHTGRVLGEQASVYAAFSESEYWVEADVPLASQLCKSVGRHFLRVHCGLDIETLDGALLSAKAQNADYLFYPRVNHWKDRVDSGREVRDQIRSEAHERSWGLDTMDVEILVLDTRSGRRVEVLGVKGRAGVANLGRHAPADMVSGAFAEVFAGLIQQPVL